MKAIESNVLVQVEKKESCTQKIGNIIIPIEAAGYEVANVISVGNKIEADIKKGDKVYIYLNAGKEIKDLESKETYKVVNISEIIVIL